MIAIAGLALYFGWPIIEAIIILLPIPDPKEIVEKLRSFFTQAVSTSPSRKASAQAKKENYTGNFKQAPETLTDDDEEDDIGRPPTVVSKRNSKKKQGLSYGDSEDEEKDGSALINLDDTRDRTHSAADNIPKL